MSSKGGGQPAGMGGAQSVGKMLQQYAPQFWGYGQGMQQQYALPLMNQIMQLFGYNAGTAPGVYGPGISATSTTPVQVGSTGGGGGSPLYYSAGSLYTGDPSTGLKLFDQKGMKNVTWSPGYGYSMTGTAGTEMTPEQMAAQMTPLESRLFQPAVTTSAQQAAQAKQNIASSQNLGQVGRELMTGAVDISRMGQLSSTALQSTLALLGAPMEQMNAWQAGMSGATGALQGASQAYSSVMQASLAQAQMSNNSGMLSGLMGIGALGTMLAGGGVGGGGLGLASLFGSSGGGAGYGMSNIYGSTSGVPPWAMMFA